MSSLLTPILTNPAFKLAEQLLLLFGIILYAATIFWAYRDANRRGAMGWFWALVIAVSVVFFPVALVVYLVVRPPETLDDARERELEIIARETELRRNHQTCSACRGVVQDNFLVCPRCQAKLRKPCNSCGKALELEWNVCPYCATRQ